MRSIQTDLLAVTFGLDVMARKVASSMIFKPLSQIIEIPDTSLNEKLVPANDNHEPTAMSRENLEAASILAPRGEVSRPSKIPLLITAVFCLVVAALVFGAWIR